MYLNCKTFFSYRYGTFSTEELVAAGVDACANSMAITNINNTADVWDFIQHCHSAGIHPVPGTEIRNGDHFCYLLLAKNNTGFLHINRFLTEHLQEKKPFPAKPVIDDSVWVIYALGMVSPARLALNELIGVQPTEVNKLFGIDLGAYSTKFVVRQPVTFQDRTFYSVHRLLRAIDKNIVLSKQEDTHKAAVHEYFMPMTTIMEQFKQYPQILMNTLRIMESCDIQIDFKADKNKQAFTTSREDDRILLEKLVMDGLPYRYGSKNEKARERVLKELKIINDLKFNAYFLIAWDVLRYARDRRFFYVGRGSGANSIVAYCLQITDVDPIQLDLYFERFLNPYRTSPPDFDIDFSWKDRNEIIDYILKRYGKEHVALLGMHTTFQRRAIIRELGKVYGLPKSEIDRLSRGEYNTNDNNHRQIIRFGDLMKNFPNHVSIHPGGMLISELPITQYTALEMPPKGFSTTQIDMLVAENVGLFKLDILSQRGLGHIKDTIELVREHHHVDIDIHQVEQFKKDPQLAAQIRDVDTIGCFYIESPSMRGVLRKLRCDDYLTLVAASSIIRPGVGSSGMMQQYIWRFHNPDKFEYLHPVMEELLAETYGVMVYQEDVIKVAHYFGGLDMGEADILRRAMSGKYRGNKEMKRLEEQFFRNCEERGHPEKIAREVWRQIESFGGYSFSKAHSASFAGESYQSLYLKTYYPIEFMVAVINNFGGFYSRELYFQQLKKAGANLQGPCVNNSEYLTDIRDGKVYVGFIHIQNLEQKFAEKLLAERIQNGPYVHLQDFIERTEVGIEQLNLFIKVGAFRFTGRTKKQLLWEGNFLQVHMDDHVPGRQALFAEEPVSFELPMLPDNQREDMMKEMELMGFPIGNVFELVDDDLSKYPLAATLPSLLGHEVLVLGYLVCTKETMTREKRELMHFGTFLDAAGDWLDTVHFPEAARRYPFQGRGFYRLKGKVIEEFGVYSVMVGEMEKVGIKQEW
ncbi:DNA polymerase III subunit alpha [[Flexibacter] sp. ATCC 35208]|uniref:DNA polymerase III subunit alpha n=1 Tax=[Flexibacter] sp. ATCC 35208 TaxID=1936242 RepID=UPI0009C724C3|nr:DNA polymerase III subunit alpha [[Flexibacter] sp. ATCC 35208]OMP78886.1 DNA polymerase III subunit alpha [[Flexibacter] sp. ATCC 35208]